MKRNIVQHRITKKYILIGLLNLTVFSALNSVDVKQVKDNKVEVKSFKLGEPLDFTIGSHAVYADKTNFQFFGFYFASDQKKKGNEFAVAFSRRGIDNIIPMALAKVTLNLKKDQDNPLTGAKINLFGLISNYPIVVKSGEDNVIYIFNEIKGQLSELELLSTPTLKDSQEKVSAEIIQIATADNGALAGSGIFAAVKNHKNQPFGAQGSGIAFVVIEDKTVDVRFIDECKKGCEKESTKKQIVRQVRVTNADPKDVTIKIEQKNKDDKNSNSKANTEQKIKIDQKIKENKAAPFTGEINAIQINNSAEIISDIIDMHWDESLARLYIALQVRSNSKQNSGARAVVSCRVVNGKLYFDSIVSTSALSGNDQIVGTSNASDVVSILKVRTMHTSTLLSYLILVGGNGSSGDVSNQLYALPLVNKKNEKNGPNKKVNLAFDKTHGTLAKYNQDPQAYFNRNFFTGRAFVTPAKSPSDLLTINDAAAKIGNGPVPLDSGKKIKDMFVISDSVFVTIADDYSSTTQPGVFYSQPIFDDLGRIISWTNWQRFATDNKIFGGAFDIWSGQFWYLTNSGSTGANVLNRTDWQRNEKSNFQNTVNLAFKDIGGMQGLFDISKNTQGFNNFSALIATGFKQIALIETGKIKSGIFRPATFNNPRIATSNVGRYPTGDANVAIIKGGILDEINNIITADIASNALNNNHWIVVGGTDGIAILANNNGNGWQQSINSLNDMPARFFCH